MTLELSLALAMEIIIALRHITRKSLYVVAEEHPLKQGLKQYKFLREIKFLEIV